MESVIGIIMWLAIGWLIYRGVRKAMAGRAAASAAATSDATAEGGTAAGSGSAVTNIALHLHVGDRAADAAEAPAADAGDEVGAALIVLARALAADAAQPSIGPAGTPQSVWAHPQPDRIVRP